MLELNVVTVLLIVGLMVFMVYNRAQMFFEHKKALADINHRGEFKKMFTGQFNLIIYALASLISVSGAFLIYFNKEAYSNYVSWLLVFLVIFITSASDVVRTSILYTTYYNDQGIFHNKDYFRYNSIKNFKPKRIGFSTEVILFNGKSHHLPTKALQRLESKIVAVNVEEKKNNKRKKKK